jgi:steroid delta-isomerase-like uncharacterized protein
MPTIEEMRAFPVRYMEEVFNQRQFGVLDELFAPELLARIRQTSVPFLNAFPDWHGTVDDIIVEGDKVVNRWTGHGTHTTDAMGLPPTGKAVTLQGITIFRVDGGQVVEEWTQADMMGLMQQLGFIPSQS